LAEANGFICELGQWVIEKACQDAIAWPADLRVSVNVASVQLLRTDVVAQVKNALTQTGLPPTRLHLEITESGFVENSARVIAALSDLRALGISIAVDDFGTGFSSLSYMAGLPLDVIKIDQSFVRKMAADEKSLAIVTSIKALAAGLNLTVVAEGVESKIEADILRTIGCEVAQGYFYAKPQPAETLQALLQSPPWDHAA
jgi:EAL domain-containing protein (putative c-di-GMP-specific phosphodiesterase class I)